MTVHVVQRFDFWTALATGAVEGIGFALALLLVAGLVYWSRR